MGKVALSCNLELDDTKGPHMTNYPPGVYEKSMQLPDDFVLNMVEKHATGQVLNIGLTQMAH